ncbi:MAG: hypothetical protein P4L74_03130 [Candidatus Doudnabacteria bacterium]|nr:hypothetical protein [Candidatus Doudnabacteria bacterium]
MDSNNKKSITLDNLAVMVAEGFNNTATKQDLEGLTGRMDKLDGRMDKLDGRMDKLEHKMEALNSNVNNYLELSEKRYSELKQRDALLAKWIKIVADKTGVPVDVSQLEKI